MQEELSDDYSVGTLIANQLIPRAVLYYTGEVMSDDELDLVSDKRLYNWLYNFVINSIVIAKLLYEQSFDVLAWLLISAASKLKMFLKCGFVRLFVNGQ